MKCNYVAKVKELFNYDISDPATKKIHGNNVLNALNGSGYGTFKRNFYPRLLRLASIYQSESKSRKFILSALSKIHSNRPSDWTGAFSELAAIDHLNRDLFENKDILIKPISLDIDIDNSRTYSKQMGKNGPSNLDGKFEDDCVFFDVKCFKDNIDEVFQAIFKKIRIKFPEDKLMISAEYNMASQCNEFTNIRNELLGELSIELKQNKGIKYLRSKLHSELAYRILWGQGTQVTERTYNPYEHAQNLINYIFGKADKFVKDKPCFLVLVSFPWFNGIVSDFSQSNIKLYRSLSRRVFCQNRHRRIQLKSAIPNFNGKETVHEVSRCLSGILFIEDKSILQKTTAQFSTTGYFYLNPNALNRLDKTILSQYFIKLGQGGDYDDFEHDNY